MALEFKRASTSLRHEKAHSFVFGGSRYNRSPVVHNRNRGSEVKCPSLEEGIDLEFLPKHQNATGHMCTVSTPRARTC